jgi:cobalamin biosynthesis Mg chelatase CobN
MLVAVAAIAAVVGSWMLVIQPKRAEETKLGTQVQALQSQLSTARDQIEKGLAARAQFSGDYSQLTRLGEALPQDDDVPSLIYQIQAAASAAKVDFRTLQMSANGGGATPAPTTSTSSSSSSSSTSSSSSGSSSSTPAGSSSSTPASSSTGSTASAGALPPGASIGSAGFPTEQFTFSFTGSFFHLSDFFKRLERFVVARNGEITVSGRLLSINSISLGAASTGFPQITATVSATTYMAPAGTGLLGGATPSGPAGTSTSTPGSSGGSAAPAPASITPTIR